jgi:tRNA A37 methylthiotransferase MiaB
MRYKVVRTLKEVAAVQERKRQNTEFIVGACLPKTDPASLAEVFNGPTMTPTDFSALDQLPGIRVKVSEVPQHFGKEASLVIVQTAPRWEGVDALPYWVTRSVATVAAGLIPGQGARDLSIRLLKSRRLPIHVSAGCNKNCAYCAIQFATGTVRSRPPELIVQDIVNGYSQGYRTFDFLSDSIGSYGLDLKSNLGELLEKVRALPGWFTIGISDLHPHEFSKHFRSIEALAKAGRLHYLYVPIQSGNERILRAMNRYSPVDDLKSKFKTLKKYPKVFLQSGIMAGFPGETYAEFEDSVRFLVDVDFDSVYVHYYCDMPETDSSRMTEKISKPEMMGRLEVISKSGIRFNAAKTLVEWESTMQAT